MKHIDHDQYLADGPFIVATVSIVRIYSLATPVYFDKNHQVIKVRLEDSSASIPLRSILQTINSDFLISDPVRTYS